MHDDLRPYYSGSNSKSGYSGKILHVGSLPKESLKKTMFLGKSDRESSDEEENQYTYEEYDEDTLGDIDEEEDITLSIQSIPQQFFDPKREVDEFLDQCAKELLEEEETREKIRIIMRRKGLRMNVIKALLRSELRKELRRQWNTCDEKKVENAAIEDTMHAIINLLGTTSLVYQPWFNKLDKLYADAENKHTALWLQQVLICSNRVVKELKKEILQIDDKLEKEDFKELDADEKELLKWCGKQQACIWMEKQTREDELNEDERQLLELCGKNNSLLTDSGRHSSLSVNRLSYEKEHSENSQNAKSYFSGILSFFQREHNSLVGEEKKEKDEVAIQDKISVKEKTAWFGF